MRSNIEEFFRRDSFKRWILLFFLILMVTFFSFTADKFLSIKNLVFMLVDLAPVGIIAAAMTFLLISGEIDLSVGANMAASSCVAAFLFDKGLNAWLCVISALIVGLIIGTINGLVVTKVGINSFIATIGMMSIGQGVAYTITNGLSISVFNEEIINVLDFLGRGKLLGINFPIIILIIFYIIFGVVLRYTLFGRKIYETGANELVSILFGVNTKRIKFINFILCGVVASFAGLILTSLTGVGMAQHGFMQEMVVISAVILGGASLHGGKGDILGTLFGVLIVNVIYNGMVLINVPYYYIQIMEGGILLIAILFYGTKTGSIFEK
jgi:ribose transport system permease protein